MTSTASAILVLFDSAAFSADVITFTFEITRMTGSAIDCISLRGCILRMRIRKRIVNGAAMTASTSWIYSVVAWVAPLSGMAEDAW